MPAIQSFISNYKSGWKAKAVIKNFSRFTRTESSSSHTPLDLPPISNSRAVSPVLDIKDDSSMDFDGGQPDEYENDVVDKPSQPSSSRPSDVSSRSAPEKLEVTLPPELRIDWFAEKFSGLSSNGRKSRPDTTVSSLDQDARDVLAGKVKEDQGLVQTLEDALALHVDSNVISLDFSLFFCQF
jgi:hypothetical protein